MPTIIDGTNGIDKIAAGAIEYADLPTGSVLQVVSTTSQTAFTTTSASFVAVTGMSVSITPKYSTSKILVHIGGSAYAADISKVTTLSLYRNSTNLSGANGFGTMYANVAQPFWIPAGFTYLDSPTTTSSTTYQLYIKAPVAGGTAGFVDGTGSGMGTITVMEIAA